ncbi:MAG: hypothetical protein F6J90_14975 [Moorea sp. SIOASIH]|nr:hypothetical protein [Moorena sp. SIOASIH]
MNVNLLTNFQPWPFGHATRTTFNLQPPNLLTFNLQTFLPSMTFLHLRNTPDI